MVNRALVLAVLSFSCMAQDSAIPPNLAVVSDMNCQAHSDSHGNWRSHVVVIYANPERWKPWELDIASGKKHNYKDGRKAAEQACNNWLDRVDKLLPARVNKETSK